MQRRTFIATAGSLMPLPALAHHGWSSFDQGRPLYLEGKTQKVSWRTAHVEFDLVLTPGLKLPVDLAKRPLPAQSAPVEGARLLAAATLPTRKDPVWHIELAPVSRMEAWKVAEIKDGQTVALVGFTFTGEKGDAVLRAEYLFVGDKIYGMRSAPV